VGVSVAAAVVALIGEILVKNRRFSSWSPSHGRPSASPASLALASARPGHTTPRPGLLPHAGADRDERWRSFGYGHTVGLRGAERLTC